MSPVMYVIKSKADNANGDLIALKRRGLTSRVTTRFINTGANPQKIAVSNAYPAPISMSLCITVTPCLMSQDDELNKCYDKIYLKTTSFDMPFVDIETE